MSGDFFREHVEAMWVTGKCRIIDEQDREMRSAITAYKNFLLRHFSYSLLLVTNPVSQPATFWRRQVMDELGVFDKNEHFVMDYDYWLRIGKRYPLVVLDECLASFRVYTASKTSSSYLRSFREELEVARRHSGSSMLNALHWLSYLGIAASYVVLNSIARFRGRRDPTTVKRRGGLLPAFLYSPLRLLRRFRPSRLFIVERTIKTMKESDRRHVQAMFENDIDNGDEALDRRKSDIEPCNAERDERPLLVR